MQFHAVTCSLALFQVDLGAVPGLRQAASSASQPSYKITPSIALLEQLGAGCAWGEGLLPGVDAILGSALGKPGS